MADEAPEPAQEQVLIVDGVEIDMDDFSFKEQREVRRILHDEITLDHDRDKPWDDHLMNDIFPALIVVYKRREDPSYSVEQALDLKPRDVLKIRDVASPTKRGAAKRSAAKR